MDRCWASHILSMDSATEWHPQPQRLGKREGTSIVSKCPSESAFKQDAVFHVVDFCNGNCHCWRQHHHARLYGCPYSQSYSVWFSGNMNIQTPCLSHCREKIPSMILRPTLLYFPYLFICVWVFFWHVWPCTPRLCLVPEEGQKRALDPPEIGITDGCEQPQGCWELNPGLWKNSQCPTLSISPALALDSFDV